MSHQRPHCHLPFALHSADCPQSSNNQEWNIPQPTCAKLPAFLEFVVLQNHSFKPLLACQTQSISFEEGTRIRTDGDKRITLTAWKSNASQVFVIYIYIQITAITCFSLFQPNSGFRYHPTSCRLPNDQQRQLYTESFSNDPPLLYLTHNYRTMLLRSPLGRSIRHEVRKAI
jgi:hypothetical protein